MNKVARVKLVIFICSISLILNAQEISSDLNQAESVGLSTDSLKLMDTYFHNLVDGEQLAGIQTAVIRAGKMVHFDSYGYANIEEEIELSDQSIFRIFSMTKPIVSVALMQLYEQGKFRLDDPLYKFIPEFKEMFIYADSVLVKAKNSIKILDLLRHTSGFSYGRTQDEYLNQRYQEADLYSAPTNKEFVMKLSELPLQFEPGTDWLYGLSTNICGHLIEILSGQDLDQYLQENIFTPLEMMDTHFQLPEEKVERFTVGYAWQEEIGLTITEQQRDNRYVSEVRLFNAGGGLVSTTMDYLKFCQMILNKGALGESQILQAETIELMLEDHLMEVRKYQERFRLPYGEYGFGLGFAIRGTSENQLEKVYGWGGAVGTYFKIDVENDMAYVLMIQLSPYRQLGLRHLFQDFVEAAIIR